MRTTVVSHLVQSENGHTVNAGHVRDDGCEFNEQFGYMCDYHVREKANRNFAQSSGTVMQCNVG